MLVECNSLCSISLYRMIPPAQRGWVVGMATPMHGKPCTTNGAVHPRPLKTNNKRWWYSFLSRDVDILFWARMLIFFSKQGTTCLLPYTLSLCLGACRKFLLFLLLGQQSFSCVKKITKTHHTTTQHYMEVHACVWVVCLNMVHHTEPAANPWQRRSCARFVFAQVWRRACYNPM